eukprot:scaffold64331_cov16-Tisochrysis_lutea.AAC.1
MCLDPFLLPHDLPTLCARLGTVPLQERDALAEQLSALQESSAAELQEAAAKLAALEVERAGFKDQVRMQGSCKDLVQVRLAALEVEHA